MVPGANELIELIELIGALELIELIELFVRPRSELTELNNLNEFIWRRPKLAIELIDLVYRPELHVQPIEPVERSQLIYLGDVQI